MKLGLWDLLEMGVPLGASIIGTPALGIAAAGAMGGLGAGLKGGDFEEMLKQAGLGAGSAALGAGFGKVAGSIGKAAAKTGGKVADKATRKAVNEFLKTGAGEMYGLMPGGLGTAVKGGLQAAGPASSAAATAQWLERLQTLGNFADVAETGKRRWDEVINPRRDLSFPQTPIRYPDRTMGLDYDPNRFMRGYSGRW